VEGSIIKIEDREIPSNGPSWMCRQRKELLIKCEGGEAKFEALRDGQQLQEMWDMEGMVVEEHEFELLEEGDRHAREENFQVGVITLEGKVAKIRKCDVRHDRHTRHLLLDIIVKNGKTEADLEYLQPRNK
jgi:hypothetical protein